MVMRILLNFSVVWMLLTFVASAEENILIRQVDTDLPDGLSVVVQAAAENIPDVSNIHLYLDGQEVTDASEIEQSKLALVICVDVSGSMAGAPLEEMKTALKTFLGSNLLRPDDQVALISIEQKVRRLQWFADQQKSLEKVAALKWLKGRKTVIYDGLYEALGDLEKQQLGNLDTGRILLISDGKDEGSNKTRQEILAKASATGIPIDVVTRVRKDRTKEEQVEGYTQDLFSLSAATGGNYRAADQGGVSEALTWIFQNQRNQYRIHFKYEKDSPTQKASVAEIWFQLPEQEPLKVKIPGEIPRKKVIPPKEHSEEPSKPSGSNWWKWVLLAVIGIVLSIFSYIKGGKKAPVPEMEPGMNAERIDSSESDVSIPRRETMVGSYNVLAPAPGRPMVLLIGVEGSLNGQVFPVEKESFYIGANPENDLCLPDDHYVSREHAYLSYAKGNLFIFDRGSLNGTFVNGNQIDMNGCALQVGDRIKIGESTLEVGKAPD